MMAYSSPKSAASYLKRLLPIRASVGGLALFLFFAFLFIVSQPIGSTVSGYFYSVDRDVKVGPLSNSHLSGGGESSAEYAEQRDLVSRNLTSQDDRKISTLQKVNGSSSSSQDEVETNEKVQQPVSRSKSSQQKEDTNRSQNVSSNPSNVNDVVHQPDSYKESKDNSSLLSNSTKDVQTKTSQIGDSAKADRTKSSEIDDSGCDLFDGKWVYDLTAPLYSNNSCPVLTQMQNCQGNGRPDKDYENWRWKPRKCDLPRFDPMKFLELMRGKTLAFIGDSVARNQMESLLCILWQAEVPKNRGNKRMQRYQFRSTSTMIIRIWSSWLVHRTSESFDFAPEGVDKLHLDAPDETFMDLLPGIDVLVLSSGHWFAKQSVYILNNEIVGGQLWWPDKSRKKKLDSSEAFRTSVETIISALVTHPNYTGLTIVRTYSPDHYEGGAWNTGGSCTGKVKPAEGSELGDHSYTMKMHDKQVAGFELGAKKTTNRSRVQLLDITRPFLYRHDGHPGPYRNLDPNKKTKRGPDGQPPPQDCLHWCMPGPVDTWNEFLFEIIRRDSKVFDS